MSTVHEGEAAPELGLVNADTAETAREAKPWPDRVVIDPKVATPQPKAAPAVSPDVPVEPQPRTGFSETRAVPLPDLLKQAQAAEPEQGALAPAQASRQLDGPHDGSPASSAIVTPLTQLAETDKPQAVSKAASGTPAIEGPTLKTLADFTVKGVRYLIREGGQTMTVRLVPESLGELRLDVTQDINRGGISVQLASNSSAVRGLLESHAHGLRDQLTQDGITVSRITISPDAGASQARSGTYQQRSWNEQAPGWRGNSPSPANYSKALTQPQGPAVRRVAMHTGALNVFV
jgi:hypothetical protein